MKERKTMQAACHFFEIPTVNFERAVAFYQQVFDIIMPVENFGGCDLAMFPKTEQGSGALISSVSDSAAFKPSHDGVRIYLDAGPDLAATLSRVRGAGGKVTLEPMVLPENLGTIVAFADSEGNVIGLHSKA